jgi:hypothetical protein
MPAVWTWPRRCISGNCLLPDGCLLRHIPVVHAVNPYAENQLTQSSWPVEGVSANHTDESTEHLEDPPERSKSGEKEFGKLAGFIEVVLPRDVVAAVELFAEPDAGYEVDLALVPGNDPEIPFLSDGSIKN